MTSRWFEEALRADDIEGFVALTQARRRCRSRPARCSLGGNRSCPWIERRAVDIIQPDVTKVGGLS